MPEQTRGRRPVDDAYRTDDADLDPVEDVPRGDAESPSTEAHRTWDPLTDPLDPADLLPLDEPGDPSLWERDRHPRDTPTWADFGPSQSPNGAAPHHEEEPIRETATSPRYAAGPTRVPPTSYPETAYPDPGFPEPRFPETPFPEPPSPGPTVAAPPDEGPAVTAVADQPVPEAVQNTVTDRIPRTPEPAVAAVGLQKRFGDFVAVSDVTFSVAKGTILGLLGPNGAGKTTTVNMLCTLLKPDAGSGLVAGHDIVHQAAAVRRSIMLTGQFAALDESLTGRENLILFGRLLGLTKPAAGERADELLAAFGLTDAARRRVGEYSGGMRRRIDIACGLVTRPEVVFLDEPTTGLDPRSRQEVWQLVKSLRDQGVTTVLTTQYLEEADELADQIVVIDHGRVIARGTTDELKSQIGTSVYQVTPADPAEVPAVREALADLLSGSPQTSSPATASPDAPLDEGESPISVSVPAPDGADTLVQIVQRTSAVGIRLSDVALRRPSLDEVFLALTEPQTTKVSVP
ncbi:ATP-binding cassette domain-containing protein [Gordonia sp. SID5947]|uniref:ATP-binding cassette domain-containing protein n=1 Tax=Gordonia sp. SID5947 TaxID=2690315 RepID=UPI00136F7F26|nr:ATP-binding cassette domain-containing protein [Gordonia sp. SID5947]MYR08755.1 ATP-binding cassette domain-containing protein [Gordonia sp. SID5947]